MVKMARNNSEEMFEKNLFKERFQDTILEQYTQGEQAYGKMFDAARIILIPYILS